MKKLGSLLLLLLCSLGYVFMIVSLDVITKKMPEADDAILYFLFHFGVLAALLCFGYGLLKKKSDSTWID